MSHLASEPSLSVPTGSWAGSSRAKDLPSRNYDSVRSRASTLLHGFGRCTGRRNASTWTEVVQEPSATDSSAATSTSFRPTHRSACRVSTKSGEARISGHVCKKSRTSPSFPQCFVDFLTLSRTLGRQSFRKSKGKPPGG